MIIFRPRRSRLLPILLGMLLLGCLAPTSVDATLAGERLVIADGHVDMGPRIVNGTWRVQLRDDSSSPPTWRELDDIVLHGKEASKITVPAGDRFAFLGKTGDPVWVLPQVQRAGIVWPGWNSQDPSVVDGITGSITWTVRSVDGPGAFTLFLNDAFGAPSLIFDGTKAYPQTTTVEPNTHVHGNWAFTKPGIYRLQMEMRATGRTGAALTDSRTLVIAVGDVDPRQVPRGGTGPAPGSGGATGTGDGSGTGGGTGGGSANRPGSLPNTGAGDLAMIAGGGAALLLAAVAVRVLLRRTRKS